MQTEYKTRCSIISLEGETYNVQHLYPDEHIN